MGLQQVVGQLVAVLDLVPWESRAQQDLGEQLERRPRDGSMASTPRLVASQPASAWMEAPSRSVASVSSTAS